jgi:hypothetical protein
VLESALDIANRYTIDANLRPAFMRATDSIGSEHERGRVLSAAFPRGSESGR